MKNNKKAFTIVELVIVIAVIAILAAVLIPTFSNIIQKSKVSSDQQLIRNLNSALTTDAAVNGKHANMQSALDTAFEYGYDVTKIEAKATGNKILWDQVNDVFCYLDGDKVAYIPQSVETGLPANDYRLWVISDKIDANYSTYYIGTEASVEISKGFDAGKSSVTAITYSTTANQSVIIRTNGGTLTINASNSNVSHYGEGTVLTIDAVASASYHEFGSFNLAEIKKGRLVVESTGNIDVLDASVATESVTVEVVKENSIANVITDNNTNVTTPSNVNKVEKTVVTTGEEFQLALAQKKPYIVLANDISATRISNDNNVAGNISADVIIDGAGHKLTTNATRGIWISESNVKATINNLEIAGDSLERAVQINSSKENVKLVINKVSATVSYYTVNVCSGVVGADIRIIDCELNGWASLNLWGADYDVSITNSVLNGLNDKSYNSEGWNDFSVINLEGDTTDRTEDHSSFIRVNVTGCTIKTTCTTGNHNWLIGFNSHSVGNVVNVSNCKFEGSEGYFSYDYGAQNKLYVDSKLVK